MSKEVVERIAALNKAWEVLMAEGCYQAANEVSEKIGEIKFFEMPAKIVLKKKVRIRRKVQQQPALKVLLFVLATSFDWATLFDLIDIFV